ncbi:hypothetical protein [Haloquadratum walsbyi]|nr:hypothetical protein [Haloquadratum walsbyi]
MPTTTPAIGDDVGLILLIMLKAGLEFLRIPIAIVVGLAVLFWASQRLPESN